MGRSKGTTPAAETEMRHQAEKQLSAEPTARRALRSEAGAQSLLHELQVHQIELEMQNESLVKSRGEVETLLEKYADLYDFAPVGYFTLDRSGTISDVNLAGAALLAVERSRLTGRRFGEFVATESRALFSAFIARVLASHGKETSVVALATAGEDAPVYVHIEAVASASGGCRAVLINVSERMQLEKQNAYFATFPRLNPNPVLEVDLEGRIIYYNPATVTILESAGLTAADVDLFLPADIDEILKQWGRSHETTLYREIDIKEMTFAATILMAPQLSTGRVYAYDITGIKRAEAKAKRSEALYRAIGEAIDYGIWICEPDGRNIYASESFLRLVGLTQQQCSDFGWGDVLHPDDAERTIAAWKECIRTEGSWDLVHRYRGGDGQWHDILARGVPVRNERGEIISWAGINLDISQFKKTEKALRRSEERLALATSASRIGIFDWNLTSKKILWSQTHEVIFGYSPATTTTTTTEEHDYHRWADRVHPEDLPRLEEESRRCMEDHCPFEMQYRIVWPDGSLHWIETKGVFINDGEGNACRLLGVVLDITERKISEEKIRQNAEELKSLNEELQLFNSVAVGRELRMIELKKEVNELCVQAGQPPRYSLEFLQG